jgi:hypothetical protein
MPAIKKMTLYALACAVVVGVVMSILVVLTGSWDWFQARVVLTSFTISGASISALACGALRERDRTHLLPIPGFLLSVCGAVLVIFALWSDVGDMTYGKVTVSVVVLATATAHLSLLSLARLSPKFAWVWLLAYAAIYGLAGTLTGILWSQSDSGSAFQLTAVLAILSAAVTIMIPILHAISRSPDSRGLASVAVNCPGCGAAEAHPLGAITCERCGCVFSIKIIREGRPI